ncbi:hypothetical protein KJ567_02360 [Candidatus Bipolaricaulota bacterium]|nr:hypothetical protein [Candidatus Bipolaricaulota bacterium]
MKKDESGTECEAAALLDQLRRGLLAEAEAMAETALAEGKDVSPPLMTSLQTLLTSAPPGTTADLGELSRIHQAFARIVHPATPRAILLLKQERRRAWFIRLLGPVSLIRGLVIAAVISVALWIGLSLTQAADGTVNWTCDYGIKLLIEELHLLAAAGVGAAFAGLFQASRFVTRGLYDPKYASSYWVRFVLGIVAGMILALLIPIQSEALGDMGAPVLAMLGGFSVAVVYRILKRLVSTVEALIGGDLDARANAAIETEQARMSEALGRDRIRLGGALLKVQGQLGRIENEEARKLLETLISDLLGTPSAGGSESSSASPREPADESQEEEQTEESG